MASARARAQAASFDDRARVAMGSIRFSCPVMIAVSGVHKIVNAARMSVSRGLAAHPTDETLRPASGADPLVRAGPPGPAVSSIDKYQQQADVGVGRGPGGPPHFAFVPTRQGVFDGACATVYTADHASCAFCFGRVVELLRVAAEACRGACEAS